MKRIFALSLLLCALGLYAAGEATHAHEHEEAKDPNLSALSYCWRLTDPLGVREAASMDTLPLNYYRQSIPSLVSDAWSTTGNLGAPGQNMIFDSRPAMSDFFLRDSRLVWMPRFATMRFYNTRQPMTLVSYNTAGSNEDEQQRLQGTFSANINPKAQFGAMADFLYSMGMYSNQAVKNFNWGLSGSYVGDKYQMEAYYNHLDMAAKENGGITDMLYITDPAEIQGGITTISPKAIPTRLNNAESSVRGDELYVGNRYNLGFWRNDTTGGDSTSTFVPVTAFIYNLHVNSAKHRFIDPNAAECAEFFRNTYYNDKATTDSINYWSVSNTLGISLLEGFNKYAKSGLSAYLTYQLRRYNNPIDAAYSSGTQHLAWLGGQLSKKQGSIFTYDATAEVGVVGQALKELKLDANAATKFALLGDSLQVHLYGKFYNETPHYLMEHFASNHFRWDNKFDLVRTTTLGGDMSLGITDTRFRASVTNLQNYIYLGTEGLPVQHGGNVQLLSASLDQKLKWGILHWDNTLTYQATSNSSVVAVPDLAVYSNLYILFRVATLKAQVGVDCDYYTSYYAPAYQPALSAYVAQNSVKIGNYPLCSVYANMKLSRTRFYVMYSHFNQGMFGGNNYFGAPYYPLNPARFQMGLSVDFAD